MLTIFIVALVFGFIWKSRLAIFLGLIAGSFLALIVGASLPQVNKSDEVVISFKCTHYFSGCEYNRFWYLDSKGLVQAKNIYITHMSVRKVPDGNPNRVVIHSRGASISNSWIYGFWWPDDTAEVDVGEKYLDEWVH